MSRFERIITFGSLILFLLSLSFVVGFTFRDYRIWPTNDVMAFRAQFRQWRNIGVWSRPAEVMRADVSADAPRATVHRPDLFEPGYRAILGYDTERGPFSIRLLDSSGEEVHLWDVTERTFGDGTNAGGLLPHGMVILPDGSVVLNQDRNVNASLARVDACGNPLWQMPGRYHHKIHLDDAGNAWTWLGEDFVAGHLQVIVEVDTETGEVLREISLEDVAAVSPVNAMKLGLPDGFEFGRIGGRVFRDIFHPNDVEPLSAELAGAFESFDAGDLLLSLRNMNMVTVIDPDTLEIKWAEYGPWVQQHDPDFLPDGTIEVYNNGTGRGATNIIRIDPETGVVEPAFPTAFPDVMSPTQGTHQRLPSGASFITVPNEGRVIEVSQEGEMIFEYNNIVGDGVNGRIMNALWLPPDYFDTVPSCPEP